MPSNFREGMRRLGIVLGVLGSVVGGIAGALFAMDAHASATNKLLGEPVLVDYVVAGLLPVAGFLVPWGVVRVLVWIWAGFSEQPNARGKGQAAGR